MSTFFPLFLNSAAYSSEKFSIVCNIGLDESFRDLCAELCATSYAVSLKHLSSSPGLSSPPPAMGEAPSRNGSSSLQSYNTPRILRYSPPSVFQFGMTSPLFKLFQLSGLTIRLCDNHYIYRVSHKSRYTFVKGRISVICRLILLSHGSF
jgi:hypothetical protein